VSCQFKISVLFKIEVHKNMIGKYKIIMLCCSTRKSRAKPWVVCWVSFL